MTFTPTPYPCPIHLNCQINVLKQFFDCIQNVQQHKGGNFKLFTKFTRKLFRDNIIYISSPTTKLKILLMPNLN